MTGHSPLGVSREWGRQHRPSQCFIVMNLQRPQSAENLKQQHRGRRFAWHDLHGLDLFDSAVTSFDTSIVIA